MTMIGAKNVTAMAKMWRRMARRKRITLPRPCDQEVNMSKVTTLLSSKVEKGCFVIYTVDSRRFVLPLAYLDNAIFRELLRLAEEEFGLPANTPITLPFDSVFMDYLIWLIKRNVSNDVLEKALMLTSKRPSRCLLHSCVHVHERVDNTQFVIQGF